MPQMAIIQPAIPKDPPQSRTAGTSSNKEQTKFSSHLDKATVNNNKQQQTDQDESRTTTSSKTEKKVSPKDTSKSQKSQESQQVQECQKPQDGVEIATAAITANQPDKLDENLDQLLGPAPATEKKSMPIIVNSAFSQLQQLDSTVQQLQNTPITNADEPSSYGDTVIARTMLAELSPTSVTPKVEKPIAATESNTLIDQLQKIIDQADETGTVSITKVTDTAPASSIRSNIHGILLPIPGDNSVQAIVPETAKVLGTGVEGLLVTAADGAEKATGKPDQQSIRTRTGNQAQLFTTKNTTKDPSDTKQNLQEHQQGEAPQQHAMAAGLQNGPSTGLSSSPQQANTFSQVAAATQETTAPSTTETAKPVILPSGTIVQEDDILQQLSNKLQISSRHMDSRINIKLHPAELGSLKIDLTVKEGSIRANVVAQSHHTSEILEKNMAKLKSVLESHGFTVDEISITAESESVSDFNLFDRQLFSHNDYAPKAQKGRREDEAVFTLSDNVFAAPPMRSGVNVKI